jgi:hypothetical protein
VELMRYLHIHWSHASTSEPDETLVELDERGCEVRVLELCRGRVLGFASCQEEVGPTGLVQIPWSHLEVLDADPDCQVEEIDAPRFDAVWEQRRQLYPAT